MLYLLHYWCWFEKALALYPTNYTYNKPSRLMFGQLIDLLKQEQDFPAKIDLLASAQRLNVEFRIPAAHKLLHGGTLREILPMAKRCKKVFEEVLDRYENVRGHFFGRYDALATRIETV